MNGKLYWAVDYSPDFEKGQVMRILPQCMAQGVYSPSPYWRAILYGEGWDYVLPEPLHEYASKRTLRGLPTGDLSERTQQYWEQSSKALVNQYVNTRYTSRATEQAYQGVVDVSWLSNYEYEDTIHHFLKLHSTQTAPSPYVFAINEMMRTLSEMGYPSRFIFWLEF